MSFLGNLLWLIFGGLYAAVAYALAGVVLCASIIGIPFGLAQFRLARAGLMPFGGEVVVKPMAYEPLHVVLNVLWFVLYGWVIVAGHLFFAFLLAITIVGLPFAKQHLKLVPLAALPFGRTFRFG